MPFLDRFLHLFANTITDRIDFFLGGLSIWMLLMPTWWDVQTWRDGCLAPWAVYGMSCSRSLRQWRWVASWADILPFVNELCRHVLELKACGSKALVKLDARYEESLHVIGHRADSFAARKFVMTLDVVAS